MGDFATRNESRDPSKEYDGTTKRHTHTNTKKMLLAADLQILTAEVLTLLFLADSYCG